MPVASGRSYSSSSQKVQSTVAVGRSDDLVSGRFQHVGQRIHVFGTVLDAKNFNVVHFNVAHCYSVLFVGNM